MIFIATLRTRRLTVELHELTIGDAIALCKMPPQMQEAGTSQLLKYIVAPEEKPRIGQVTDPRLWTAQERAFVVAHYLAHIVEGDMNFAVGDSARYSDYLALSDDVLDVAPDSVELGIVAGNDWSIRPLLGAHAESIERLVTSGRLSDDRAGWWFGAMAAQLVHSQESPFDVANNTDGALDEYLAARVEIFKAYPDSDFMDLLEAFLGGMRRLDHIFRLDFGDQGVIFLPTEEAIAAAREKGVPGLPPARFPFPLAVSERASSVFGNAQ